MHVCQGARTSWYAVLLMRSMQLKGAAMVMLTKQGCWQKL